MFQSASLLICPILGTQREPQKFPALVCMLESTAASEFRLLLWPHGLQIFILLLALDFVYSQSSTKRRRSGSEFEMITLHSLHLSKSKFICSWGYWVLQVDFLPGKTTRWARGGWDLFCSKGSRTFLWIRAAATKGSVTHAALIQEQQGGEGRPRL